MDHQSEVNWLLGISEGRDRAVCRRGEDADVSAIAKNLDQTNYRDLQQQMVNADADATEPEDISGVARTINAMRKKANEQEGEGEADGEGKSLDAKDLDSKVKAVRTDFEAKHGADARAMLRAHVMDGTHWSAKDEPMRKTLKEMVEDDRAWDAKRAAHSRMGGAVRGYDNQTIVYG